MLANIFLKTTRERTIAVLVGAFAVAAMFMMGMAVYRTVDVSFYYDLPPAYLELIGIPENGDVGGLAFGAIFNTIGALTLGGLAISMGTASIAGEEANGTIGILLGNPKSRSHVLLSKAASIVILTLLAIALLWGASYLVPALLEVSIEGIEINALMTHMLVNTLFYGFLALAIGSWTGRGSTASGVTVGIMVVGWLAVGMLPLIESIAWTAELFPWWYYTGSEPLVNGVDAGHLIVLGGATIALGIIGLIGVNRRDLKTRSVKRTMLDRLRDNPMTAKLADRLAGSARVQSISAKTMSDHQGLLVATGAILFYMGIIIGVFWRYLPESIFDALDQFPDALTALIGGADLATPAGWFQAETFSLVAPIAMFALTIIMGSKALAGEEEQHTMGLLATNPLRRTRIVQEKVGAMVILAVILGIVTFLGNWIGALLGGADVSWDKFAATSALLTLLGLVMGAVSLLVSAWVGSSRMANYTAVLVALVSYFTFSFFQLSESFATWAKLSPFHYYLGSDPLVNGMDWGHALVLFAAFVVLVGLALPLFERRDLKG